VDDLQKDQWVRRIYMTDKPFRARKAVMVRRVRSGHYEPDGTLWSTPSALRSQSYLDWYRTPHTEKEHVVERYKVFSDGRVLEVLVKVEDPETFNETLYMGQRWRKVPNPATGIDLRGEQWRSFRGEPLPIPEAKKFDF